MLVWGGYTVLGEPSEGVQDLANGSSYDPARDHWDALPNEGAPSAREGAHAFWTGSEVLVWGGTEVQAGEGDASGELNDGALYNPAARAWRSMSQAGAPAALSRPCAVWTGGELVVWGGTDVAGETYSSSGSAYDSEADSWRPITSTGAPSGRHTPICIWGGDRLFVWGGIILHGDSLRDGGLYDPVADEWTAVGDEGFPEEQSLTSPAVWTGSEVLAQYAGSERAGLVAFDPAAGSWRVVSEEPRLGRVAFWTGQCALFWYGSEHQPAEPRTNGCYDTALNRWADIPSEGAPPVELDYSAVWTGSEMIVWGGNGEQGLMGTGGRYRP